MLKTSGEKATSILLFKGGINKKVRLEKVSVNLNFVSKEDAKLPEDAQKKKAALTFHFVNYLGDLKPEEKRILDWVTYEPNETNEKALKIFQDKFSHIYEVLTGGKTFPVIEAETYGEFYTKIAAVFNNPVTEGETTVEKPIYKNVPLNVKAVFDRQGRIGLGFPNFVEKFDEKATTTTLEQKKGELFELPQTPSGLPIDTAGAVPDLPF